MLAAAIRSNAQVIVTWNLSDFPATVLEEFDIQAQSPDRFVRHLIDLAPARVAQVLTEQASSLEAPPLSLEDLVRLLRRDGLATAMVALEEERGEAIAKRRTSRTNMAPDSWRRDGLPGRHPFCFLWPGVTCCANPGGHGLVHHGR